MENSKNASLSKLVPVMLCFFVMGFVDLVGIASNYVKADLNLTDSQANIFPSLVFFWFLIFSVPTGMLMNRIGRKKTVLLSLVITFASLLLPIFGDSYLLMLVSFSLLGIGNALMQTSLNPLLSTIVSGYTSDSVVRSGVACIVPHLSDYFHCFHSVAEWYEDLRRDGGGKAVYVHSVSCFIRETVHSAFLYRYHVSCWY